MYHYCVTTNTYSIMSGSTAVSALNGLGYDPGDNYIYGISGSTFYQIGSDRSHAAGVALTGATPATTGGDSIAANQLLTASSAGAWTSESTLTYVVCVFTSVGSTWKAYDFAHDAAKSTGYGMAETTLYIGHISGSTVTVTTKAVTGSGAAATDNWRAS